jgi:hypothetical protein
MLLDSYDSKMDQLDVDVHEKIDCTLRMPRADKPQNVQILFSSRITGDKIDDYLDTVHKQLLNLTLTREDFSGVTVNWPHHDMARYFRVPYSMFCRDRWGIAASEFDKHHHIVEVFLCGLTNIGLLGARPYFQPLLHSTTKQRPVGYMYEVYEWIWNNR